MHGKTGALVAAAVILLSGCGDGREKSDMLSPEEMARRKAIPIEPQPILYPDIEKHKLFGPNCAFAADGHGIAAVVLAMREDGYMKLREKMVRFAADSGSRTLPMDARSRYSGKEYAFEITLEGEGVNGGKGHLRVTDAHNIVVYEAPGTIQCNG